MRIEGAHTFAATKAMVWSLLHDPAIISRAIPGCETFDQISPTEYLGSLIIEKGPYSGEYKGNLKLTYGLGEEAYSLNLEGSGPEGSLWAEGHITLSEEDKKTTLHYEGEVVASGSTVSTSPRLLQTTARAMIRQFFAEIERYIEIQTGIYTTQTSARPSSVQRSSTMDIRERMQELQQDRRTTIIVIILLLLASFMTIGAIAIAVILVRFGLRFFRGYIKNVIREEKQNDPLSTASIDHHQARPQR